MRWMILLLIPGLLGACASSSGPTPAPIGPARPTAAPSQEARPSAVAPIDTAWPVATPMIEVARYRVDLPDLGEAPELNNEVWLNTDRPIRLADVRGKVVVLDMWTFGCINCRNVIPSLRDWHSKYAEEGLIVIGNHYPEFDYERDVNNLQDAIQRLDVPYAVAQDNDGATWQAYRTRYWPTLFVIDKRGHLRYTHIGEGAYAETERVIQELLKED
jgi:thiol-disulfide isomerase/thioredoxin